MARIALDRADRAVDEYGLEVAHARYLRVAHVRAGDELVEALDAVVDAQVAERTGAGIQQAEILLARSHNVLERRVVVEQ